MEKSCKMCTETQEYYCWHRNCDYLCRVKETKGEKIMATAIKAIPTLYGDAARRFRDMADEAERKYDERPKRDITKDPSYIAMCRILERSNLSL